MKNSNQFKIAIFVLFITTNNALDTKKKGPNPIQLDNSILDQQKNLTKNHSQSEHVMLITPELSNENKIKSKTHFMSNMSLPNKIINETNHDKQNNEHLLKKNPIDLAAKITNTTDKNPNDECSKVKLDTLILSLNWPVNICTRKACILDSPQRWFIQNLRYVNSQDQILPSHCCDKRPFNISELSSTTINELKEHMPSILATKPDESLWFEEYTNFGACLTINEKLNTVYKYFNETIRLFKETDLEQWLKAKNIVPLNDINKVYDFDSFYQAIYAKRPFKFQIICNPFPGHENNISIIDNVNFCVNNNLDKINCPSLPQLESSSCHKKVVFPSLDAIESVISDKRKRFNDQYKSIGSVDRQKKYLILNSTSITKFRKNKPISIPEPVETPNFEPNIELSNQEPIPRSNHSRKQNVFENVFGNFDRIPAMTIG